MKPYLLACLLLAFTASVFSGCRKDPDDDPKQCKNCPIAYKPNIYIYPEKAMNISVTLGFPKGGYVVESIPEYGSGWHVNVTPDGKIDGTYDYLFYESKQPDEWQQETGWVIAKDSIEHFFKTNLAAYHFKQNEIKDFIEYWTPKLTSYNYYNIYPQELPVIEKLIQIDFSSKPEHFLRLFYLIEGRSHKAELKTHIIGNTVARIGYHAAEWGVILK